jgi:hypothetical protein
LTRLHNSIRICGFLANFLISGRLLAAPASEPLAPKEMVARYCAGCHNQRLKTGGLALDQLDPSKAPRDAEIWEKVIRKLRGNLMPPAGLPRPDAAARSAFVEYLETALDRAAEARPNPGQPLLHRMNRAEYVNAIRDLLALDVDGAALLPPDDSAYGFDNISDVLGLSPALQEHYLSAAMKIGALAVGDGQQLPGSQTYRLPQDLSQNQHIEGMPLGTVGGMRVRYNFPLDAEYVLRAKLFRTNLNIVRGLSSLHQVEIAVDGKRVRLVSFGGGEDLAALFETPTDTGDAVDARLRVRVPVKAGPHEVTVAFLEGTEAVVPTRLEPYLRSSIDNFDWTGFPHLQTFSITGPFEPTGSGDTPSRRRVFVCHPANKAAELPCAKRILSTLLRRGYRRPVESADLDRVLEFYRAGRDFENGIEIALERILASPQFIFRIERDPEAAATGSIHRVSDVELASRLSYFLWSSIPDTELLALAERGLLKDPPTLDRQVRRMLRDAKSDAVVENFAGQWLRLRNTRNIAPNSDLFPDFDDNLRQSMRRETELLFSSVLREDRNILDLLNADYTFVNERLARHYGIPDVYGSQFRRVPVTNEERRGILGQGSILAVTSHAERTSPVLRGKWVLENILGTPVPPPPPDVPPLKETAAGEKPRTMRQQMAEHRTNPACAVCHQVMDPIGLALEEFDAVGAWRSHDGDGLIDASGQLADGTKVDGVVSLRKALTASPDLFARTFTGKLLTYALGRGLTYHDMPVVRSIVREAARSDYRFSAIVLGIVRSTPFQMRSVPVVESARLEGGVH